MEQLVKNIEEWSKERGLDTASPITQTVKLLEESGELANGLLKGNDNQVIDSLGDIFVVITILAQQKGLSIIDCVDTAYNEIKNRTGKMINGTFVKSDDLKS